MITRWEVTVAKQAECDILKLSREQFCAVETVMALLASETDPRRPRNPRLNVRAIEHDAPGWYRVRTLSGNMRVVFRLLQKRKGGSILEIGRAVPLISDANEQALQITQAAEREHCYGKVLAERWDLQQKEKR